MEELTGRIKEVVYYANGFGVIKFEYGKTSRFRLFQDLFSA